MRGGVLPSAPPSTPKPQPHLQVVLDGMPHHDAPLEQLRHQSLHLVKGCCITQAGGPDACGSGEHKEGSAGQVPAGGMHATRCVTFPLCFPRHRLCVATIPPSQT